MPSIREQCEIGTLVVSVLWVALTLTSVLDDTNDRRDLPCAAFILIVELVGLVSITQTCQLPKEWLRVSRTCPDNGLIYVCLISGVFSSLMSTNIGQENMYYGFLLCSGFVLSSRFLLFVLRSSKYEPNKFDVLGDLGLSLLGTVLWAWMYRYPSRNLVVPFLHLWLVLAFHRLLMFLWLKAFFKSFTIGEAILVIQAVSLFCSDFIVYSVQQCLDQDFQYLGGRTELSIALEGGILGVFAIPLVMYKFFQKHAVLENETLNVDPRSGPTENDILRRRNSQTIYLIDWTSETLENKDVAFFYGAIAVWLGLITSPLVTVLLGGTNPIIWVKNYTFSTVSHALTLLFWVGVLAVGLPLIHWAAAGTNWPLIITRKLYHIMVLVMFIPAVFIAPDFLALSFGIACALFLTIEYVRICQVPPVGKWIHFYLRSYTDSRDEGVTILTHIYLLVGCAVPLWIFPNRDSLAPYGGLVVLGAGDAAGAIIGSTYGRVRWPGGRKTLEGTVAALMASLLTVGFLSIFVEFELDWPVVVLASVLTCLLEAFTKQIDNLTLPIFYSMLLSQPFVLK